MTRLLFAGAILLIVSAFFIFAGCDKEKIVESTEYIHDVEYVELPPDTVYTVDTLYTTDSVHAIDTVFMTDTVVQVEYHYDTVMNVVTDTVLMNQCSPNEHLAFAALQNYADPLVLEFINNEFGINEGWIFYLSAFQVDLTKHSADVYDIYGYIDYWMTDWSAYYPLEFNWRMTFTGTDPANLDHWEMSDPPTPVSGHRPGINLLQDRETAQPSLR